MSLLALPGKVADIKRLRNVITLISEAGFAYALTQAHLTQFIYWHHRVLGFLRLNEGQLEQARASTDAERLRVLLIRLGPTYIKLGQMLSVRSDLLPPEYMAELGKLTDQVPPAPFKEARAVIEGELGKTIAVLFDEFDEEPIGAASLAQVYRAKLWSGERVAVKVQRPGIRPTVQQDISLLRYLAAWVERNAPELAGYRPVELFDQFAEALERELDFVVEASHAARFEAMFANSRTVKIARVYDDYSTGRILTMDLIEGAPVTDATHLRERGIDPKIFARNGAQAILRQIFIDGFFHADPHPGNYFALPDNVFAFIDYGMVGRLNNRERWELSAFFLGLLNRDSESAIRHLLRLAKTSRDAKLPSFEHDVDDIVYLWIGSGFRRVQIGQAFGKILESGRKNGVYFPASLALLAKALYTTEAMGRSLDPQFDMTGLFHDFSDEIIKSRLNLKRLKEETQEKAFDTLTYSEILPEEALRLLTRLSDGELRFRVDDAQLKHFEHSFASMGMKRLGVAFAGAMMFIGVLGYLSRTLFRFKLK